jgi:UDP-N-acetylmuramoyl-L-alanyl-D-glutamate--2,6-diaminopimelate ligase
LKAKKLLEIVESNEWVINLHAHLDPEVANLQIDSRRIESGDVFVTMKGTMTDGHDYIATAIQKGASLIICEVLPESLDEHVMYAVAKDVRKIYGYLAHALRADPSESMKVIGVTGTNGKTTVASLLHQLFTGLGYRCGLLSTTGNLIGELPKESTHTTGDAVSIAQSMFEMKEAGCEYVFMEVSSHAAEQCRIHGIDFDGAIFTNISHDHLDYHKTMLNYINAKKKFFDMLPKKAFALVNTDDRNGSVMVQNTKARIRSFGLKSGSQYRGKVLADSMQGMQLKFNNLEFISLLSGEFNASNLLAVYASACELSQDPQSVLTVLSGLRGAEGRMDKVIAPGSSVVGIVDYAHTPDALEKVLKTIRKSMNSVCRLITVVGCGGDRDKSKRPVMAKVAYDLSDCVIITSDNPRSENPEDILDDMQKGIQTHSPEKLLRISDRKSAIQTAVVLSKGNDVILVAGKGHEKYQEINGEKFPFDDKMLLHEFLRSKSSK